MAYKEFDPDLHDMNDERAKTVVREYFGKQGFVVTDNPDKYGIDLFAKKGDKEIALEVEIKHEWRTYFFPFSEVNIPKRKAKYKGNDNFFIVLSSNCRRGMLIESNLLKDDSVRPVPNKYVEEGGEFYKVRVSECKFIDFLPKMEELPPLPPWQPLPPDDQGSLY